MDFHHTLVVITFYFLASVIAVAVSRKAGLGAIIGYLAAGILLGPDGLGIIGDPDQIQQFSELGVVLLLFVIGLELSPQRLMQMRKDVFGLGSAQVLACGLVLGLLAYALGQSIPASVVIGAALALSSTAFALQMLSEQRVLGTPAGQKAFAVLLFQDMAVIPFLAIIPLLAVAGAGNAEAGPPLWVMIIAPIIAVASGHFALNPLFRLMVNLKVPDAFVGLVLVLPIGFALLFEEIGYSLGLGAFIAGILLAESEFRHQVEATVEPFKGLLLGLFFVAVGMGISLSVLAESPLQIILIVGLLLACKILLIALLGRVSRLGSEDSVVLGLALGQGGEFAFVLFALAGSLGILDQGVHELLVVAIAISMICSQVLFTLWFSRSKKAEPEEPYTPLESFEGSGRVIIAGFGRFGQIIGRVLSSQHIHYTAIDRDSAHIQFVRRFGNKVYFGDVTDLELLRKAGIEEAQLLVLAIDHIQDSLTAVRRIRSLCPQLPILARAHNRMHAYELLELGVTSVHREMFGSSLGVSLKVLEGLGLPESQALDIIRTFREHDERVLRESAPVRHDMDQLVARAQQSREELQAIFDQDSRPS